jgi:hypothetical protein
MLVQNSNLDSLYSNPKCHVMSKTFSISKNTADVDTLLLKFSRGPEASYITMSCCDVHGNQTSLHYTDIFLECAFGLFLA